MTRTPPRDKWWCTKCARPVTAGVAVSMDPRFATGLCLHGKTESEAVSERVPLVSTEAKADEVIDARREKRAVRRAMAKRSRGEDLSANEEAAPERHRVAS